MTRRLPLPLPLLVAPVVLLAILALVRPIDHDESQYVAATALAAQGLLPYRDFAYLQMPLQPLALAPVVWLAGWLAYPALRLANAALGLAALAGVYRAGRTLGASPRAAALAAAGLGLCDAFLFSATVARNDALPAALFAWGMALALAELKAARPRRQLLVGLLLAGAAAAKISYGVPALVYGGWLLARRDRAAWRVLAGAMPVAVLVLWLAWQAPQAFRFDVFAFPAAGPAQYYVADGRGWKLGIGARLLDAAKFLALGPALLAAIVAIRDPERGGDLRLLALLVAAGLVAALLPAPLWRQYLLPALIPLFARIAIAIDQAATGRLTRVAAVVLAIAGLAPSAEALATGGGAAFARPPAAVVYGPVATLSPELLPARGYLPDPRFATGPFYFRSDGLLSPADETRFVLVSHARLAAVFAVRPSAILVGGEGTASSGDARWDALLADWARAHGYRAVAADGLTLYVVPR